MRISEHFGCIIYNLRSSPCVGARNCLPPKSTENPDIISVFALASSLCEAYHRGAEPGNGLILAASRDGGLAVMAAAIDFAWMVECVACRAIDWNQNGEVWPYFLEDHAEEILALTSARTDEEFEDRILQWLGEQEAVTLKEATKEE